MKIAWLIGMMVVAQDPPKDPLAEELRAVWQKANELCAARDRDELQKLLAGLEFTREELAGLFGEERTARVHPRYRDAWKKVLQEAAADLIDRRAKSSWEEVDVWAITGLPAAELGEDDRHVVASLVNKDSKVYNIRQRAKGATGGFVLRCFVKTGGGWRMGLKIGRHLGEQ